MSRRTRTCGDFRHNQLVRIAWSPFSRLRELFTFYEHRDEVERTRYDVEAKRLDLDKSQIYGRVNKRRRLGTLLIKTDVRSCKIAARKNPTQKKKKTPFLVGPPTLLLFKPTTPPPPPLSLSVTAFLPSLRQQTQPVIPHSTTVSSL